jgi:hypothetical protein
VPTEHAVTVGRRQLLEVEELRHDEALLVPDAVSALVAALAAANGEGVSRGLERDVLRIDSRNRDVMRHPSSFVFTWKPRWVKGRPSRQLVPEIVEHPSEWRQHGSYWASRRLLSTRRAPIRQSKTEGETRSSGARLKGGVCQCLV